MEWKYVLLVAWIFYVSYSVTNIWGCVIPYSLLWHKYLEQQGMTDPLFLHVIISSNEKFVLLIHHMFDSHGEGKRVHCLQSLVHLPFHPTIISEAFFFLVFLQWSKEMQITRHKIQAELWMDKAGCREVVVNSILGCTRNSPFWSSDFLDHRVAVNAYHHCTSLWHLKEAIRIKQTLSWTFPLLKLNALCMVTTNTGFLWQLCGEIGGWFVTSYSVGYLCWSNKYECNRPSDIIWRISFYINM